MWKNERGSLVLKTAPTVEPITTAEAKTHMRITTSDDDTYVGTLIVAARRHIENIINRALINQTWNYYLNCFPYDKSYIEIPIGNLSSVTSIKYINSAESSTTWTATNYIVDTYSTPGRVVLAYNIDWPSFVEKPVNAVNIEFVSGYGSAVTAIPEGIKQAALLLVQHWFDNREMVSDLNLELIPETVEALLSPYRIYDFA